MNNEVMFFQMEGTNHENSYVTCFVQTLQKENMVSIWSKGNKSAATAQKLSDSVF